MLFKQRPKKDRLINLDNPKQAGIISLIIALVSLLVLQVILSIFAVGYGLGGVYYSIKKKLWLALLLNILAVLVGLTSFGLWVIY